MGGLVVGRIRSKTSLRGSAQDRAEEKFFSFVLADTSGEINVVCAHEAENTYELLQVGRCYKLRGFYVKKPTSAYHVTDHEFELRLNKASILHNATFHSIDVNLRSFPG